ncbi:hypothetical protein H4R99_003055 [Coemansia sp. RSA 1722]|nr:hypothetical protein IWW45_003042 [Coemansia sp. RSA 485]KAJ2601287.1 hypothetical protein H4R99_003055 [Coemansia sp. RSA 1722]
MSKLTEEEQLLFRKYGKLPKNKNERKYFDSGDYALNKAGKTKEQVGAVIPSPESIHHHSVAAEELDPMAPGSEEVKDAVSSGAGLPGAGGLPGTVSEHQITSPLSTMPPISASLNRPQLPGTMLPGAVSEHQITSPLSTVSPTSASINRSQVPAAVAAGVAVAPNEIPVGLGSSTPRPPAVHPQLSRRLSTNCTTRPQITRRPSTDGGNS